MALIIIPICVLAWVLWLWLGRRMVKPHRTAILATAIPLTLLAIATVVSGLLNPALLVEPVFIDGPYSVVDICWLVGFYLATAASVLSVVFAIMRKWEIAKGIGFGGVISLVVSLIVFVVAHFL